MPRRGREGPWRWDGWCFPASHRRGYSQCPGIKIQDNCSALWNENYLYSLYAKARICKKGSWESSSHWKKGLSPTLKSMTVWWKHTLDQTQGGQSKLFVSSLPGGFSSLPYYSMCNTRNVPHRYPRRVSPGDHQVMPRNFAPSPPCPGKAPVQCVAKVMFNPGAPSQILASAHSLSTNCAHGNYAATRLVGNLPSPTWRQPCGPLLLLLKSNRFLALTLYLYPAPKPPCFIGAVCPGDSDKDLGLLYWHCSLMTIFSFNFFTLCALLHPLLTHSFHFFTPLPLCSPPKVSTSFWWHHHLLPSCKSPSSLLNYTFP